MLFFINVTTPPHPNPMAPQNATLPPVKLLSKDGES